MKAKKLYATGGGVPDPPKKPPLSVPSKKKK